MGNFLTTNQWNLVIISTAAAVVSAILGVIIIPQARTHWYWALLYVLLYFIYVVFFYKAFSV
jgi:uncharacterized membrane protein YfcA